MKKFCFAVIFLFLITPFASASIDLSHKIAVVNLKECIEKSLLGKKEKKSFDKLKENFSKEIEKLEKELESIARKLKDDDYLEGLSSKAIEDLRHKFEELNQDYQTQQNQFYQIVNQTNYRLIQNILSEIKEACNEVRLNEKLDVILNDEYVFSISEDQDITKKIISIMNQKFCSSGIKEDD